MQSMLYILYMSNRTTIGVSKETLQDLTSTKYELKVRSLEDVVKELLEEHKSVGDQ